MKLFLVFVPVTLYLFLIPVSLCAAPGKQPFAFRSQIVMDQQGFGIETLRILVPKGWTFKGGVTWNFGKVPPEVITAFTISSPDGFSVAEMFPPSQFYWGQDRMHDSYRLQMGITSMAPQGAIDFLQKVFIPRLRPYVTDVKVLETQSLPSIAESTLQIAILNKNIYDQICPPLYPYEYRADAGRVKLEYSQKGRKTVEDFMAVVTYFIQNAPTIYGGLAPVNYWTAQVASFQTPADEVNKKVVLFQIISDSMRINPVWSINCTRLSAVITREQLREQNRIFARLRQINQTYREIDDIVMKTYENRSASQDRIFENYSEAIRGVDTYIDPVNNLRIQLPTGYENTWTNGTDYLFSDSADFNPNVGSTANWKKMTRQR